MKVIAKAKPVKIRIKSGGEEHSSLDSLKRNFNIEDIKFLLDGRLSRWLRQQDEVELAYKVDGFVAKDLENENGTMNFIKLFFSSEFPNKHISLLDLADSWKNKYKKNSEYLYKYIFNIGDLSIKKFFYKNKDKLQADIDWFCVFNKYADERDGEVQYILGSILINHNELKKGLVFMHRAVSLNYSEAINFFESHASLKGKYYGVNRYKIFDWFNQNWNNKEKIKSFPLSLNPQEQDVVNFICQCQEIVLFLNNKCGGYLDVLININKYFDTNSYTFFKKEIDFIEELIKEARFGEGDNKMVKLSKNCNEWADLWLSDDSYNGIKFRDLIFEEKIIYIVSHLFDYE